MININDMPHTTVEQVVRFRAEAIRQINELERKLVQQSIVNHPGTATLELLQKAFKQQKSYHKEDFKPFCNGYKAALAATAISESIRKI